MSCNTRNYEEIAARFWNLPSKGVEEASREQYYMDDIIQKAHLEREISTHLDGVKTVLDAGAGAGRFSIPLAQKGLRVTHYDISQSMLAKAQNLAKNAGVAEQIEFVEGRLTELSRYQDGQFDLVICTDAPVSYSYPGHKEVLGELARIAGKSLIVSVSSRLGYFPYFFNPIQKLQYLVDEQADDPVVQWYVRHGQAQLENWTPDFTATSQFSVSGLMQDPDSIYAQMEQGETHSTGIPGSAVWAKITLSLRVLNPSSNLLKPYTNKITTKAGSNWPRRATFLPPPENLLL